MNKLADVALPVGVDKTFTYLIPPDLESSAIVGVRTTVPFGRKYATGVIVDLPPTTTLASLKPLRDIIDAQPIVSGELMQLCRWIAEYYCAPLGEVLKAAMPHGFSGASKRIAQLLSPIEDDQLDEIRRHSPKRARLLALLKERGPTPASELRKAAGLKTVNSVLNELEKTGLVRTEEFISRPRQSLKKRDFLLPGEINIDTLTATLDSLPPRKKRGRKLLEHIRGLQEQGVKEIAVADLLKRSGASSATLKEFKTTGLINVVQREITAQESFGTEAQTLNIILNTTQKEVVAHLLDALNAGTTRTFLLHGVTGSGKTQVYIEAIRHCLKQNKSAIVLVPEISLTPQIVRRFKSHFGDKAAVVHSRMSPVERQEVWRLALRGDYRIVVGPRSAVFAPLKSLGLIVVDEEHEASYKQYDATPRYHARDVAIMRGHYTKTVVVLGSATPSAESYFNAMNGKYTLLEMPHRIDRVPLPAITIVDMTEERRREYESMKISLPEERRKLLRDFHQSPISRPLRDKIEDRLARKEGIILLQNRRGFAPFVECQECGYTESCDNCSITLTYHLAKKHLRCHYCGHIRSPHAVCPQCRGLNLQLKGVGTQRVEEELSLLFPHARVLRMDLDTTSRKGAHDRLLRKFGDAEADILLGTQMVAKGLDFARVTLVGVISADTQMLLPDFRSSERTFQLLTQVAGRAGRSVLEGEVIIQTHQPKHYTLQHVVDHDFKTFYEQELEARKELNYPPFSRLVLVQTKGKKENAVRQQAELFVQFLKRTNGNCEILGPSPAVIAKVNNQYRWHIILKNRKSGDPSGSQLRRALRAAQKEFEPRAKKAVQLTIDVDPVGLM